MTKLPAIWPSAGDGDEQGLCVQSPRPASASASPCAPVDRPLPAPAPGGASSQAAQELGLYLGAGRRRAASASRRLQMSPLKGHVQGPGASCPRWEPGAGPWRTDASPGSRRMEAADLASRGGRVRVRGPASPAGWFLFRGPGGCASESEWTRGSGCRARSAVGARGCPLCACLRPW